LKISRTLFISIFCFATAALLFSCGGTSGNEVKKETWFSNDSTMYGENFHYGSNIDSFVENRFFDKEQKKRQSITISKTINNVAEYSWSMSFDSSGKKINEGFDDLKTSNSIMVIYDDSENVRHEVIRFYSKQSGNAVITTDYENKKITSIFYSGKPNYREQEYDSAGRISFLSMPYVDPENKTDSTIIVSYDSEKDKAAFKDTLYEQASALRKEFKFPVLPK
jgi:hypothetical protein